MKYAINSAPKGRAGSRRNALKLGLAGIAVAGIGAALTSAAWTDNVWFEAPADGATFNLQASLTGAADSWVETSQAAPLTIASSAFDNLVPGETRTVDVYVLNDSNVEATVVATPSVSGALSQGELGTRLTVEAVAADPSLEPDASTTVTLTLTVPENWPDTNKGKTGAIQLTVEGTS